MRFKKYVSPAVVTLNMQLLLSELGPARAGLYTWDLTAGGNNDGETDG